MIILQVFIEDSGIFSAIAENRGGKAKCSANLLVEQKKGKAAPGPPNFLTTIQDKRGRVGVTIKFDAKVAGNKPMDVYWLKVQNKTDSPGLDRAFGNLVSMSSI